MTENGSIAAPAPWRDGLAIAGAALVLYLLLAQEALHGLDVHVHVFFLTQGHLEHPLHFLYLKIVGAAWPLLRECGLSPHHALRLMSAIGSAAFVLGCHRAAARLHMPHRHAMLVAALCAVPGANLFFATVPEIHGVFGAFAGVVWWAAAALVEAPGLRRACVLGLASGVASSVHATGHLQLGTAILLWWALSPARGLGVASRLALGAGVVHVAVATGFALWLQPARIATPFQGQLEFLRDGLDGLALGDVTRVLCGEWLLVFLPLSLTALVAPLRSATRRLGLATLAALGVYLALCLVLLHDLHERGAYLLPLVLPFALCTLRALGTRLTLGAGLFALGWGIVFVGAHDHIEAAAWVDDFVAVARDEPLAVICRDVPEQEQITRAVPDVPFVRVDSLVPTAERGAAAFAQFCAQFDGLVTHYAGSGRRVFITRAAYETMAASGQSFFTRFLTEHLARHYRLEEVVRGGFAAYRVRPR